MTDLSKDEADALLATFMPDKDGNINLPAKKSSNMPLLVGPSGWNPPINKTQHDNVVAFLRKERGSPLASTALICKKDECHYKGSCPLYQEDPALVPEGSACPIELSIAQMYVEDYMRALEISEDDVVDLAILKQYVMWQLYMRRAQQEMALDAKIVRKEFMGVDSHGHVLSKENMHPVFLMLEKGSKRMQKLMESLLATREAKSKADTTKFQGLSTFLTALQDRIAERKEEKLRVVEVEPVEEEPAQPQVVVKNLISEMAAKHLPKE